MLRTTTRCPGAAGRPAQPHLSRGVRLVANSAVGSVKLTIEQAKEGASREIEVEGPLQLRAVLMAEKVDLYTTWGKVWQCGGVGQCGTCIVEVKSGAELLSERTAVEDKKLKGKPASWRLACQTLVGDGETSGEVTIATKPQ